jgi:hypothetical protein
LILLPFTIPKVPVPCYFTIERGPVYLSEPKGWSLSYPLYIWTLLHHKVIKENQKLGWPPTRFRILRDEKCEIEVTLCWMNHWAYANAGVSMIIGLFVCVHIVILYLKDVHNVVENYRWHCCWSHVEWYVPGDDIPKLSGCLVFRTKVSPLASTVPLVPDNTDDTWGKGIVLPQLVKPTIHLVKGLNIGNNDLILYVLNVLFILR